MWLWIYMLIAIAVQLYPDARSSSYSCEISGAVALIKFASGDLQRKKNTEKNVKNTDST